MEFVVPASAVMLSEWTMPGGRARIVPFIGAVESVNANGFTACDSIEAFESSTATTRPSPRGLFRGSTQSYAWLHAATFRR